MKKGMEPLENACKEFEEDLVLYYYGDGSPAERDRVEKHIQRCGCCFRFLEDLRKLLPQMAKAKEIPASFWDNYYKEVVEKLAIQQERGAWWRSFLTPLRAWTVPAFGTAAVAVFAVALILSNGNWDFSLNPSGEKIPQEILTDTNQLEFFKSMDMLEALSRLEVLDGTKLETRNNSHS